MISDGACGFKCIALHCCHNEAEFKKIRRHINKFIIHHWELLDLEKFYGNFQEGIQFNVGMTTQTFHSKIEFLCFLDTEQADILWMDHLDLQMAANTYNVNINVLSTDLQNPVWTHMSPVVQLKNHSCEVCKVITYQMELPKHMKLLHNGNHYQLFVPKGSPLAETLGYKPSKSENVTDRGEVSSSPPQGVAGPALQTGPGVKSSPPPKTRPSQLRGRGQVSFSVSKEEFQSVKLAGRGVTSLPAPTQLAGQGELSPPTPQEGVLSERLKGRCEVKGAATKGPSKQTTGGGVPPLEKYNSDSEDTESDSDEWETDDDTVENKSDKIGYIGNPLKEDYKKLYELKMAENVKLTSELNKYMAALKEETAKRSEATDLVNILKITKDSESKIETLMNTLKIQESENDHAIVNTNPWNTQGKDKGFKRNNKPQKIWQSTDDLVECPPCEQYFPEKEIEKHVEEHLPGDKIPCNICGVEMIESALEEHTQVNHNKIEQQCTKCPKAYSSSDHIKRHIWRAHTPTECSLCGTTVESRQILKHHKETEHKVTQQMECKYAKEGKCIDGEECLFRHSQDGQGEEPQQPGGKDDFLLKISCEKCQKCYNSKFEVKRHEWRVHEPVDCRLCGQALESRQLLETHKKNIHGITKQRECKYWVNDKCVDGNECLFSHESKIHKYDIVNTKTSHKENTDNFEIIYCKAGLKCTRTCGINESGHKKVKDIPCKFGQACKRNICHFKHNSAQGFHGNQKHTRNP